MARSYDVVIIGGGHNGLICGAYLARAGLSTLIVEARNSVGGCASTVDAVGGRVNICNCDHLMIRATPVIDELDLAGHGLAYIDMDPAFVAMTWDGDVPWMLHTDADATLAHLEEWRPGDVDDYRRYLKAARPVARLVASMAGELPTPMRVTSAVRRSGLPGATRLLDWQRRSAIDVLTEFFSSDAMIVPALTTGPVVWGVCPTSPGTGLAALAYAMRHEVQVGRPFGGSGALTDAIAAAFVAAGGEFRLGERVRSVDCDGGPARRVVSDGGEVTARVVVGACDPATILCDLARTETESPDPPEGYESKIDARIAAPPRYRLPEGFGSVDAPTAVISPTLNEITGATALRGEGRVPDRPMLLVNTPSAVDPAMVPDDGGHILSLEVLWTPYSLVGGWEGSPEPRRWLDQYQTLLSEPLDVAEWRAMTPPGYESQFGMRRGYAPSYPGSPVDALLGRPRPLARYRTDVDGLYLTGAATYPGAGIWGASGRNTAHTVLTDLGR